MSRKSQTMTRIVALAVLISISDLPRASSVAGQCSIPASQFDGDNRFGLAPASVEGEEMASTAADLFVAVGAPSEVAPDVSESEVVSGGGCRIARIEPEVANEPAPSEAVATPGLSDASESIETLPVSKPSVQSNRAARIREPLSAWWSRADVDSGKLKVRFVGAAAFTGAIAVLTDGHFDSAASANQFITVSPGGSANRTWLVAKNPQMLLLPVPPGRYRVQIKSGLLDSSGNGLGTTMEGHVEVQ